GRPSTRIIHHSGGSGGSGEAPSESGQAFTHGLKNVNLFARFRITRATRGCVPLTRQGGHASGGTC
ncbi:MAG: hypothetical protein ACK56I_06135, partial [bacterium]